MMNVKFCRIDDRLIHGQVVTTWVNVHKIDQIIILSEAVANDEIQKSVLKMSAPTNITLHVFSPKKFMEIIEKNPIKKKTMLLFNSVYDVEEIIQNGFPMEKLNIGGMRSNPERQKITKAVSLTSDEKEVFKRIMNQNVDVEIQMVPNEQVVLLKEVI